MTDHLCNNRHRILAVLQSLGAEPDSAEVAEVFQAVGAIEAEAERLANAAIAQERDEARDALADRDAAWERAIAAIAGPNMGTERRIVLWQQNGNQHQQTLPDYLADIRQRLDAELNRPKRDWSEVRQRLRDAGADRWDEQRSWRERSSESDPRMSESVIRDRDAGDECDSLAAFDKRCQHEQDGRDGYIERMLD